MGQLWQKQNKNLAYAKNEKTDPPNSDLPKNSFTFSSTIAQKKKMDSSIL